MSDSTFINTKFDSHSCWNNQTFQSHFIFKVEGRNIILKYYETFSKYFARGSNPCSNFRINLKFD